MAEELNCDLDENSHQGCSDGGSKSSIEEVQERRSESKENFQASEKLEDVLDLDYDEGSPNLHGKDEAEESSDGEINDSSDEDVKQETGEKEEGEIDDSDDDDEHEINVPKVRRVPIQARLSRPVAVRDNIIKTRDCPYEINGSCTWGPDCNYIHRSKNQDQGKFINKRKVAEETSWERGLREAREAMRRASKKREEPEFEIKRLTAAPTGERIRNAQDSDSDDGSSSHRLHSVKDMLSTSNLRLSPPVRRHIPSLLDITTLAPPRYQNRSSANRDGVRSATRGSPCYSEDDDSATSRHNLDCGRLRDTGGYRERREIKDLGPQVRYPCGRPQLRRNEGRRSVGNDNSTQQHFRQDKARDSTCRPRRESPSKAAFTKVNRVSRISPSLDVSPISSDSSISPARSPRKSTVVTNLDKECEKSVKKKVTQSGSAMGDVTDPWARKKKTSCWPRNKEGEGNKRGRSTSNSSTSSSDSNEKVKRTPAPTSSSRVLRRSRTPSVVKADRRLSPPRGDITGFRIPKKHHSSVSNENITRLFFYFIELYSPLSITVFRPTRVDSQSKYNIPEPKKSGKSGFVRNSTHRISRSEAVEGINSRGAENISDSDSARSVSRSVSFVSSSSSSSSPNRSPSPALPAKYRVVGNKGNTSMSLDKNTSSMSDSDDKHKKGSRVKVSSREKKKPASPQLRAISPSPSPPPPPPPLEDAAGHHHTRERSVTPPPPPPPLPLIHEFVVEKQTRKMREPDRQTLEGRSKSGKSPPKKKAKIGGKSLTEKERRKRELIEQLRAVEAELKKRTAATSVS
ncbi:hypothetical protein DICVIV_02656 [Dictyocaulus viviparus]|uniref:C3H1-type domain-containing protein n=1 Tax=Dictyocaulus viviparus TaxID=29172 RepID=A0A0D8Y5E3_DICVI|nr:hypothetical protein DICVIV_02656 [Dictyocaulus viviparus]